MDALPNLLAKTRATRKGLTRLCQEVSAMLVQTGSAYGALASTLMEGAGKAAATSASLGVALSNERAARRRAEGEVMVLEGELGEVRMALGRVESRAEGLEVALSKECHKVRCMRDAFAESKGVIRCALRVRPLLPCDLGRGDNTLLIATKWALVDFLRAQQQQQQQGGGGRRGGDATSSSSSKSPLTLERFVRLLGWWHGSSEDLCKALGVLPSDILSSTLNPATAAASTTTTTTTSSSSSSSSSGKQSQGSVFDLAPACLFKGGIESAGGGKERLLLPPELSQRTLTSDTPGVEASSRVIASEGSSFDVDRVFGPLGGQEEVFSEVRPFLDCGLRGKGVTVLAYGATGSGKSHSVLGGGVWPRSGKVVLNLSGVRASAPPPPQATPLGSLEEEAHAPGLLPRALVYVWDALRGERMEEEERREGGDRRGAPRRSLTLSVMEVYNDSVRDLIVEGGSGAGGGEGGGGKAPKQPQGKVANGGVKSHLSVLSPGKKSGTGKVLQHSNSSASPLPLHAPPAFSPHHTTVTTIPMPDGVGGFVVGEEERDLDDALAVLGTALSRRCVARTVVNDTSSRSHCIVRLVVREEGGHSSSPTSAASTTTITTTTTLNIVDLAGMENVRESRASGGGLVEACAVNASLAALGDCITAVAKGNTHVPFRSSRLTRILEPSLKGNSRVFVLLTASLMPSHKTDLVSTVKFASRVTGVPLGRVKEEEARGALLGYMG